MNDSTKIGAAIVLLVASAVLLFWSSLAPEASWLLMGAAALATTGLAAGSLLMGSTGTDGRTV